jgi:hypothetical protein
MGFQNPPADLNRQKGKLTMGTITQSKTHIGYCVFDKSDRVLQIDYHSFPQEHENRKNMTFLKSSNQCPDLNQCPIGKECPIHKDAKNKIILDVSHLKF